MCAEKTIHIVSHRADRRVRKEIIQRICGITSGFDDNTSPVSQTRIVYNGLVVDVIDCDFNLIGDVEKSDVFIVDLRGYADEPYTRDLYAGRIAAAGQFTTVWCLSNGNKSAAGLPNAIPAGFDKIGWLWTEHIEYKLDRYAGAPELHTLFMLNTPKIADIIAKLTGVQFSGGFIIEGIDYDAKNMTLRAQFG